LEADEESGTFVHYWPDDSIFQVLEYRMDTLADRLRELAFLNKDVRISIRDLREDDPELNLEEFHYEGGIVEFVEFLDEARTPVNQEVIYIDDLSGPVPVEVAMRYCDAYNENVLSFVNNIN